MIDTPTGRSMRVLEDYDGQDGVWIEIGIDDPVVLALVDRISIAESDGMERRLKMVADMLEIGARMMQRHQDGQSGDLIRRELERVQERLADSIETMLSGTGRGFADAVRPVLESVNQELSSIGGRLDGALALSKAQVELEQERDRGTAKGRTFEQAVAEEVSGIARHCGDACEHVGDVGSLAGRAGDVLVEIGGATGAASGRIVFEAKTGRLTLPEAMRELDRARRARAADFAVLVVDGKAKLPSNTYELREYGGDKMVVSIDADRRALGLAYSLARARVLARERQAEGIDVSAAEHVLSEALRKLDSAATIKHRMTAIQNSAEEAKAIIDGFVSDARDGMARAMEALRGSE